MVERPVVHPDPRDLSLLALQEVYVLENILWLPYDNHLGGVPLDLMESNQLWGSVDVVERVYHSANISMRDSTQLPNQRGDIVTGFQSSMIGALTHDYWLKRLTVKRVGGNTPDGLALNALTALRDRAK
ncbi:hypothetical protein VNO78_11540 [Psophocarpus tetragonolobus]|uniref:Uncharacterized protein n=1 Tax=Psophocarpus tetragonolobus TaxID=3891 RepID=A0AAN9SLM4_PSOTE